MGVCAQFQKVQTKSRSLTVMQPVVKYTEEKVPVKTLEINQVEVTVRHYKFSVGKYNVHF